MKRIALSIAAALLATGSIVASTGAATTLARGTSWDAKSSTVDARGTSWDAKDTTLARGTSWDARGTSWD